MGLDAQKFSCAKISTFTVIKLRRNMGSEQSSCAGSKLALDFHPVQCIAAVCLVFHQIRKTLGSSQHVKLGSLIGCPQCRMYNFVPICYFCNFHINLKKV